MLKHRLRTFFFVFVAIFKNFRSLILFLFFILCSAIKSRNFILSSSETAREGSSLHYTSFAMHLNQKITKQTHHRLDGYLHTKRRQEEIALSIRRRKKKAKEKKKEKNCLERFTIDFLKEKSLAKSLATMEEFSVMFHFFATSLKKVQLYVSNHFTIHRIIAVVIDGR